MKISEFFKGMDIKKRLGVLTLLLTALALVFYIVYAMSAAFNLFVILFAAPAIVSVILSIAFDKDYLCLLSTLFISLAVVFFLCEDVVYGSFVDFLYNIHFFGDTELLWVIITVTALYIAAIVTSIVREFLIKKN